MLEMWEILDCKSLVLFIRTLMFGCNIHKNKEFRGFLVSLQLTYPFQK